MPEAFNEPQVALAAVAGWIAAEPDLAAELARIESTERFLSVLAELARQRGIALTAASLGAFASAGRGAHGARISAWPLMARRGWQPYTLERGPQGVELVWGCGAPRAGAAFHEATVADLRSRSLNRLFAMRTPLTPAFIATLEAEALPVAGLVFHMSRCGSTLIAEALKAWAGTRVLSEPALLDTALMMALCGQDPHWQIFRAVLAALAQPEGDAERVLIKLDAWHALALEPLCSRLPTVPWLFVYRDPVEVLVSHVRNPGRHTQAGMLPDAWLGAAAPAGPVAEGEHAARVLGAICAQVVPWADAQHLVNYTELPQALVTRIPATFGLDPAALDGARLGATLAHHTKRPDKLFVDDGASKRGAASADVRAYAERWIAAHYAALEQIRCAVTDARDCKHDPE